MKTFYLFVVTTCLNQLKLYAIQKIWIYANEGSVKPKHISVSAKKKEKPNAHEIRQEKKFNKNRQRQTRIIETFNLDINSWLTSFTMRAYTHKGITRTTIYYARLKTLLLAIHATTISELYAIKEASASG